MLEIYIKPFRVALEKLNSQCNAKKRTCVSESSDMSTLKVQNQLGGFVVLAGAAVGGKVVVDDARP